MKNTFLSSLFVALFFIPAFVFAGPIIRTGETVSVEAAQKLEGDFYGVGSFVTISGEAEHDVYVLGGSVTTNAPVKSDLVIVGGTVQVHGEVGDDLRVVGKEVTVGAVVKGDLVVVGQTLTVLSTAAIEGDIIFNGDSLRIEGPVDGTIHGTMQRARIDSDVQGDIEITVGMLTLGDGATVYGDVHYASVQDVVRSQNAQVIGDIHKNTATDIESGSVLTAYLMQLAIFAFAALTIFYIARPKIERLSARTFENIGANGLIGLGTLILAPVVIAVLFVSIIGAILGLPLLFLFLAGIFGAIIASSITMGAVFQKYAFKKEGISSSSIVLGSAFMAFLIFVPVLGQLTVFAIFLITLGAITKSIYLSLKEVA